MSGRAYIGVHIIEPFTHKGRVYRLTPQYSEPRHSSPALPWQISIKGDFDSNAGELGIVKVCVDDPVTQAVMYPKRGGAHNPHDRRLFEPPRYYERGEWHYKAFCSECARKHNDVSEGWKRRSEFYVDRSRGPGRERLQRYCKDCMKDYVARRRQDKPLAVA